MKHSKLATLSRLFSKRIRKLYDTLLNYHGSEYLGAQLYEKICKKRLISQTDFR